MAKAIAKNQNSIEIPLHVKKRFSRAIEAREAVSQWAARAMSTNADGASDARHQYFINVLKDAFDILWPFTPTQPKSADPQDIPRTKTTTSEAEQFENRFSHLTVEESSETDHSENVSKKSPATPKAVIERSQTEIEEEFFFAIDLLLHELQDIRGLLYNIWKDYEKGALDLVVASLMTNTAIDLVRQVEQAFESTLQRPARFPANLFPVWTLPTLRYCANYAPLATATSSEIERFVQPSSGMMLGFSMTGCEFTFYPVFTGLRSFLYQISGKKLYPEIPLPQFGSDPSPEDLGRTIELAMMYRLSLMTYASDQWTHDEVTRGMEYFIRSKTIPIWVTFGVQVLLDVGKIMENSMSRPFNELCQCAPYYTGRDQPSQRPFANGVSKGEKMREVLEMLKDSIHRACQRDQWYETLRAQPIVMGHSILARVATEEFFFLKRQPILCGLMKYRVYTEVTLNEFELETSGKDMLSLAYVYKAARMLDPATPTWPDMELALYRQDPSRIFYGQPETLEAIEKAFFLIGGSSAVNSAKNGRRSKPNLNNIQTFEQPNSSLTKILYHRLNQTARPEDSNINKPNDTVVRPLIQGMNEEKNQRQFVRQMNMPRSFKLSNFQQLQSLSSDPRPVKVLRALICWLNADQVDLYFDWKRFKRQCTEMWTDILKALSQDPEWKETDYMQGNVSRTPTMATLDILWLSVQSQQMIFDLGIPDAIVAPQLRIASEVIQRNMLQPVKSGQKQHWAGDACIQKLVETCSVGWFFAKLGPAHFGELYKNWSKADLRKSEVFAMIRERMTGAARQSADPGNWIALAALEKLVAE